MIFNYYVANIANGSNIFQDHEANQQALKELGQPK